MFVPVGRKTLAHANTEPKVKYMPSISHDVSALCWVLLSPNKKYIIRITKIAPSVKPWTALPNIFSCLHAYADCKKTRAPSPSAISRSGPTSGASVQMVTNFLCVSYPSMNPV